MAAAPQMAMSKDTVTNVDRTQEVRTYICRFRVFPFAMLNSIVLRKTTISICDYKQSCVQISSMLVKKTTCVTRLYVHYMYKWSEIRLT